MNKVLVRQIEQILAIRRAAIRYYVPSYDSRLLVVYNTTTHVLQQYCVEYLDEYEQAFENAVQRSGLQNDVILFSWYSRGNTLEVGHGARVRTVGRYEYTPPVLDKDNRPITNGGVVHHGPFRDGRIERIFRRSAHIVVRWDDTGELETVACDDVVSIDEDEPPAPDAVIR